MRDLHRRYFYLSAERAREKERSEFERMGLENARRGWLKISGVRLGIKKYRRFILDLDLEIVIQPDSIYSTISICMPAGAANLQSSIGGVVLLY